MSKLRADVVRVTDTIMEFKVTRVEVGSEHGVGEGSLRWDGCLDMQVNMHFCAPDESTALEALVRQIYALGESLISEWEGG